MILDGRLPEGYVVLCVADGDEQRSFLVQRLGPSVECPECGRTALSAPLVEDYYRRRQVGEPAHERSADAPLTKPRAEFRAAAE